MTTKEIPNRLILDERKFERMIKKHGLKVDFVGGNIALIKSKYDNWQVQLDIHNVTRDYRIELNHMHRSRRYIEKTTDKYHVQGYFQSYGAVVRCIVEHDRYIEKNESKRKSRAINKISKIDKLLNMVENGTLPQLKPQLQK